MEHVFGQEFCLLKPDDIFFTTAMLRSKHRPINHDLTIVDSVGTEHSYINWFNKTIRKGLEVC